MSIFIFLVVFAIIFYIFIINRKGNLSFWKKASKDPDFVYSKLLESDAWLIINDEAVRPREGYDGPFLLYVPSIGRAVKFYGEIGKYEDSQREIDQELTRIT